jgi:hypothetical protein
MSRRRWRAARVALALALAAGAVGAATRADQESAAAAARSLQNRPLAGAAAPAARWLAAARRARPPSQPSVAGAS